MKTLNAWGLKNDIVTDNEQKKDLFSIRETFGKCESWISMFGCILFELFQLLY
jgi:hypothetical protein